MPKSRKKRLKTKTSDAVNRRDVVYTYHPIDEKRSIAIISRRCSRCGKVTDKYCIDCHTPLCKRHLSQHGRCARCAHSDRRPDYLG